MKKRSVLLTFFLLIFCLNTSAAQDARPVSPLEPIDWQTTGFMQGIVTGRFYDEMAAYPERFFDDWYNMNIDWIRIEFEEFMYNPDADFDSDEVLAARDQYLTILEEAHKRGIRVLGLIGVNSMPGHLEWEGENEDILTEETIDRYLQALRWHLDTYPLDAVEIFNEPWGFGFGSEGPRPLRLAGYARILIAAYTKVKPDYPHVTFMAPATANAEAGEWLGHHGWGDSYRFLPEASIFNSVEMQAYRDEHDGALPLDVITWHPYGTGMHILDPDPAQKGPYGPDFYFGRDFATYFNQIMGTEPLIFEGPDGSFEVWFEDVAGRNVIGDYPIFFTEYAWQSESEEGMWNVRSMYEDMIEVMQSYPQIKGALIYTYRDDPPIELRPDSQGFRFGLYQQLADGSYVAKPIYYAFLAHNSGVGLTEDGRTVDQIVLAYLDAGGRGELGLPVGSVMMDNDCYEQPFEAVIIRYCADDESATVIR